MVCNGRGAGITSKTKSCLFSILVQGILDVIPGATSIRRTFKSAKKKLFNASKEFHISDYFHLVIFWNALRIVFPSMLKRAVITPIFKKDHSLIVVVVVVGLLCNSTGDKVPKCSTS